MDLIQKAKEKSGEGKIQEAIAILSEAIGSAGDGATAEMFFERGKLYWRLGERSRAASDYAAAAELDPEGPAVHALEHARHIEDFFNPDLLNP